VMGDSYGANYRGGGEDSASAKQRSNMGTVQFMGRPGSSGGDLMLIPHRLALALQADGWTCRNDVVWSKKSPMPESVAGWRWERCKVKVGTRRKSSQPAVVGDGRRDSPGGFQNSGGTEWADCPGCSKCEATGGYVLRRGSWRHTRAHETVLQLTKGMGYACDQEKVREAASEGTVHRFGTASPHRRNPSPRGLLAGSVSGESCFGVPGSGRNPRDVLTADELDELWCMFLAWLEDDNPLDVLTPRPESYKKNHYAVYPASLITPLIRASCPTRCCPVCGAAWAAVVERESVATRPGNPIKFDTSRNDDGRNERMVTSSNTLGYRATCAHDADAIPGTILDPFVGSGTTLVVARELGLNAIGLDLSPSYLDEHARPRIGLTPSNALEMLPLFQEVNA